MERKKEKYYILKEKDGKFYIKNAINLNEITNKNILNETRLKILKLLSEEPLHPLEISRRLNIPEQNIYYHIKHLEKAGLVYISKKINKRGTIANIYSLKANGIIIDIGGKEELFRISNKKVDKKLLSFFYPHIKNDTLNSTIVVGSPDPHGPYQVRARDGHYAVELAFFLGAISQPANSFSVKLDVDVKAEQFYKNHNLILIGGVLTNILTYELNKYLKVKFSEKEFPFRSIYSEFTEKMYEEETTGLIAKIPNPFNKENSILIFAGIRFSGTKSAIMGITKFHEKVLKDYNEEKEWYRIVNGLDMDGDGKIDSVEVLE